MEELYRNEIVRNIFETTPDMIAVLDENGKILECNHHLEQNTGYTKNELIGITGPIDLVYEKDREKVMHSFEQVKTNGTKLNVTLLMKRKDSSIFPSIWSGSTLYNKDGEISGYLVTGKDLSEIEELKNKLLESQDRMNREKLAMMGELSARIAHDIRNPLSIIQNSIDMLVQKDKEFATRYKDTIEKIKRADTRIAHQIDDVLDYVRPKPLILREESICKIINQAIDKIKAPEGIAIDCLNDDICITCDSEKMEIVFINLIMNAIQALGTNGDITIRCIDERDRVSIKVTDTGPGIPAELLPKIFDPLFTTKQIGTGLGLVSCKNIVERHGGKIDVTTEIGHGTTFTVTLPKKPKTNL